MTVSHLTMSELPHVGSDDADPCMYMLTYLGYKQRYNIVTIIYTFVKHLAMGPKFIVQNYLLYFNTTPLVHCVMFKRNFF